MLFNPHTIFHQTNPAIAKSLFIYLFICYCFISSTPPPNPTKIQHMAEDANTNAQRVSYSRGSIPAPSLNQYTVEVDGLRIPQV